MKQLVGRWEGSTDNGGTDAVVTYRLTGRGTSLVEILLPGTAQEMMTVYDENAHGDLVGTHYCSAGDQPEIRLVRAAGGGSSSSTLRTTRTSTRPPSSMGMSWR